MLVGGLGEVEGEKVLFRAFHIKQRGFGDFALGVALYGDLRSWWRDDGRYAQAAEYFLPVLNPRCLGGVAPYFLDQLAFVLALLRHLAVVLIHGPAELFGLALVAIPVGVLILRASIHNADTLHNNKYANTL